MTRQGGGPTTRRDDVAALPPTSLPADLDSPDVHTDPFTSAYREHYSSVRAYAAACVPASEVDDIVAETFLVAWRRWAEVPTDWMRGWLIGVARNTVRSRRRATRRATSFLDQLAALPEPTTPDPDEHHQASHELRLLRRAMSTLTSRDQEILLLAGPYGLQLDEISLALDVTKNAATVRLHRARQRLRGVFEDLQQGGEAA